jgi:hypothetical protein
MPDVGSSDVFELRYMAKLRAILAGHGIPVDYQVDRAAIDTGLHLFATGEAGTSASQVRVWFQAKGKRSTTLGLEAYRAASTVPVQVRVDHLQYWYAAPEPVYLVLYVESADEFLAEDVRDVVDRQWPHGAFYREVPSSQQEVTVHLHRGSVLDDARIASMLRHRSMRIDGPAFRGRPLGHRFDPLRSRIAHPTPDVFLRLVNRLLDEHDFRLDGVQDLAPDVLAMHGRMYQTLEWQSPAFAEYGYGPDDDFRVEPSVESIHGPVAFVVDSTTNRQSLDDEVKAAVQQVLQRRETADGTASAAICFNALDLSGAGGLWRSVVREMADDARPPVVHHLGLEALSSLLLVCTLVYMDFGPELAWDHVNYR